MGYITLFFEHVIYFMEYIILTYNDKHRRWKVWGKYTHTPTHTHLHLHTHAPTQTTRNIAIIDETYAR